MYRPEKTLETNFGRQAGSNQQGTQGRVGVRNLQSNMLPLQFLIGRTGRGQNPPPQLGQTLCSTFSTQRRQKVHSKVQIIASTEFGGSAVSQFSQTGLSSSIERFLLVSKGA